MGYDLIPFDQVRLYPLEKLNIKPKFVEASLTMAIIGLRDVVPSIDLLPVNKVFCKFDISGDSKIPVSTFTHVVKNGSCSLLELVNLDIEVPLDLRFAPTLTVYVYDTIIAGAGERLVGTGSISLLPYCRKIISLLGSPLCQVTSLDVRNEDIDFQFPNQREWSAMVEKNKLVNIFKRGK